MKGGLNNDQTSIFDKKKSRPQAQEVSTKSVRIASESITYKPGDHW